MRAFTELWDRIGLERYGVTDPKARRFRYGVQVNSLGLTEAQPENNVQRIVLEALGVTLSKRRPGPLDPAAGVERGARPAPAVGPAVVAAHPAGAGLRDRPARVRRHLRRLAGRRGQDRRAGRRGRQAELDDVLALGGAFEAIDELKGRLVRSHAERIAPHRVGRADRGRRQPLHRDGRVAARRRRSRSCGSTPPSQDRADRRRAGVARRPRQRRGEARPRRAAPRRPSRPRT